MRECDCVCLMLFTIANLYGYAFLLCIMFTAVFGRFHYHKYLWSMLCCIRAAPNRFGATEKENETQAFAQLLRSPFFFALVLIFLAIASVATSSVCMYAHVRMCMYVLVLVLLPPIKVCHLWQQRKRARADHSESELLLRGNGIATLAVGFWISLVLGFEAFIQFVRNSRLTSCGAHTHIRSRAQFVFLLLLLLFRPGIDGLSFALLCEPPYKAIHEKRTHIPNITDCPALGHALIRAVRYGNKFEIILYRVNLYWTKANQKKIVSKEIVAKITEECRRS